MINKLLNSINLNNLGKLHFLFLNDYLFLNLLPLLISSLCHFVTHLVLIKQILLFYLMFFITSQIWQAFIGLASLFSLHCGL